jgi:hypothetical protein
MKPNELVNEIEQLIRNKPFRKLSLPAELSRRPKFFG